MIFKMKQAVVISILIVSLVSFAHTHEETQAKETERSYGLTDTGKGTIVAILIGVGFLALGGSSLLDGGRRNSQYGPSYQKQVSNQQLNNRIHQGIVNYHHPLASNSIRNPTRRRARRAAPIGLTYRRDGTISLRCRYSPETCRNVSRRRSRRGGKRLFSLYLKPPAEDAFSLDNVSKKYNKLRGSPSRVRNQKQAKGKRIFSIRLKSPTQRPVQKFQPPSSIYGRAFERFKNDITPDFKSPDFALKSHVRARISSRRSSRPPPRVHHKRSPRHRGQKRQAVKAKLPFTERKEPHEIFSLFLKPPAPLIQRNNLRGPITGLFRPRRPGPKSDIPLICRFQPDKCGRKGYKLFSIRYNGFKNVFPNAFPLI